MSPPWETSTDEAFGERYLRLFQLNGRRLHMDAGAVGAPLRGLADDTPTCSTFAEVRRAIAPGFGCDADEIVVTNSTTDSLCKIIAGIPLRAEDEVLTTNHEHYGSLAPLAIARDRFGVARREVELPVGSRQRAEDYLEAFAAAIGPRTRVILFSAPTATTGAMLPIQSLARLAQEHDCISVVDGAHIPGMMSCHLHQLGVDFLAGSGHKWQYGPPGTGLLYVRNKVLEEYNARPLPEFWPVVSIWYPLEGGLPARTATRQPSYDIAEYLQTVGGSAGTTRMNGVRKACELWDGIGRGAIERHLCGLGSYLKLRICEEWGEAALYSPLEDSRLHSPITTFNPFRHIAHDDRKLTEFTARMESECNAGVKYSKFKVRGCAVPHFAVRLAPRIIHSREDIDTVVRAMRALSQDMDRCQ